jgi:hypothetical protein
VVKKDALKIVERTMTVARKIFQSPMTVVLALIVEIAQIVDRETTDVRIELSVF